jgi:hypothetical protein
MIARRQPLLGDSLKQTAIITAAGAAPFGVEPYLSLCLRGCLSREREQGFAPWWPCDASHRVASRRE